MSGSWKGLCIAVVVASMAAPAIADPPPVDAPRVFCFRVTDIEADPTIPNRFVFEFEFLNWTDMPAHGTYIWVNEGTTQVEGSVPILAGAGVDPDGRGGPPGGQDIGPGIYGSPAHQSGRGRGDLPGHRNDWEVVFAGTTSVFWGNANPADGFTAIPFRSILTASSPEAQYQLVPGLGYDGLPVSDSAIDGGPPSYGPPIFPAPRPTGGQPSPDGSGNVLDGFTITVDDFHPGEVLSFNWILTDESGESIGQVGASGNVVGNEMGFGVFNLTRITPGSPMGPGPFVGNSGFTQGINFFPAIFELPDPLAPPFDDGMSEFAVEFGAALTAPPLSATVNDEQPASPPVPLPNIDPVTVQPNTNPVPCSIPAVPGDASGNGVVKVNDLQCTILVAVYQLTGSVGAAPGCLQVPVEQIDINCDGAITIVDAQLGVNLAFSTPLPTAIDQNGNNCHDTCDCSSTVCDDGNACTVDGCDLTGNCVYEPLGCVDGDPCTFDGCNPATGCIYAPVGCAGAAGCFPLDGDSCNDGDACTTSDACSGGVCVGGTTNCDDDNPCTQDSCDSATGCVNTAITNGTACGTGSQVCVNGNCITPQGCGNDAACNTPPNACITFECVAAQGFGTNVCAVASELNCDDGNSCTDDSCDPAIGCINAPNDLNECDDGTACTVNDRCQAGACVADPNDCDDGNPCSIDFCDGLTGCYAQAINAGACDDGNACSTNTFCVLGHCIGEPLVCNDGLQCTSDSCDSDTGCVFEQLSCDDSDPCTDTTCTEGTGCTFAPTTGNDCEDGDPCTALDTCQSGTCTAGVNIPACNDGSPTICALSGQTGELVSCPVQVVALDALFPLTSSLQISLSYPTNLMLTTLNDGQFCAPSDANCQMVLDWDIPSPQIETQTGHSIFLNPSDLSTWNGGGEIIALNLLDTTTPLTTGVVSGLDIVGDAVAFELIFELTSDIDPATPAVVTATSLAAVTPDALEMLVLYDDFIIFTGGAQ